MTLAEHRRELNSLIADRKHAKRTLRELMVKLEFGEGELVYLTEAQQIAQDIATAVQQKAHERIAGVVTRCLQAVFPDPYEFKIIFEKKRGKTDARMVFIRASGLELHPDDGVGGSVLDVASFALRLACLGLQKPKRRRVVFIDEGFRGVSNRQDNKERMRDLLNILSKELEFQIIQVTHDDGLKVGRIIEV